MRLKVSPKSMISCGVSLPENRPTDRKKKRDETDTYDMHFTSSRPAGRESGSGIYYLTHARIMLAILARESAKGCRINEVKIIIW